MAENWLPLASPGNLTQTKVPVVSLQCAEAMGKRAWLSTMGGGPLNKQTGGGIESCYKAPDLLCLK
jgi:hypothetical protein